MAAVSKNECTKTPKNCMCTCVYKLSKQEVTYFVIMAYMYSF